MRLWMSISESSSSSAGWGSKRLVIWVVVVTPWIVACLRAKRKAEALIRDIEGFVVGLRGGPEAFGLDRLMTGVLGCCEVGDRSEAHRLGR
jgi:hypothetical protein